MTDRRRITVAVDASWLHDGGIGRMAQEILRRKPDHVDIVEIRGDRANAGMLTPVHLAFKARAVRADAIWSPGFMPPLLPLPGKRCCITIHDLAHLHHYGRKHRIYYDLIIRTLLRNVDLIFTVSDFTRREIIRWAGVDEVRVVRIYNGVSDVFGIGAAPAAPAAPYVLYVGNRRSYKNLDRLIAAFARSSLVEKGYELWLTGKADPASQTSAAAAGIAERVRYLGHVSDTALAEAYRGARALAFVSLYEGFGLPVVEAMACGCPVLTSDSTALAEVAGDAGLTIDAQSIDAIAVGLDRIALDEPLRAQLRDAGLRRAGSFDWRDCAAAYWRRITDI